MEAVIKLLTVLLITTLCYTSTAQTMVASSGTWENSSTWSPNGLPGDDEVLHIPEGVTVTLTDDHIINNTVVVIDGTLRMGYNVCGIACVDYASLRLTGPNSAVIVTESGSIEQGSTLGGSASYIEVDGEREWSAAPCVTNCGNNTGTYTSTGETAWPSSATNPLPVVLTKFWVESNQGHAVLHWQTASEVNNERFEIQKSLDGEFFDVIGSVDGNGTTTLVNNYSYSDNSTNSSVYYRLRQVDFDGKYEFSKTIFHADSNKSIDGISVFPNPSSGSIKIDLGLTNYVLYDQQGRIMNRNNGISPSQVETEINRTLGQKGNGTFILKTTIGDKTLTSRIIRR